MRSLVKLCVLTACHIASSSQAADKTRIDYFRPMPVEGALVSDVWGAPGVFPRDPKNGLEDETMKQWDYWDGQIIKGPDGKQYHIASVDGVKDWTPQAGLLIGGHGDAVVSGDRAWWFYFSGRRRCAIDVVELSVLDGRLVAGDPMQPTYIDRKPEREQER